MGKGAEPRQRVPVVIYTRCQEYTMAKGVGVWQ